MVYPTIHHTPPVKLSPSALLSEVRVTGPTWRPESGRSDGTVTEVTACSRSARTRQHANAESASQAAAGGPGRPGPGRRGSSHGVATALSSWTIRARRATGSEEAGAVTKPGRTLNPRPEPWRESGPGRPCGPTRGRRGPPPVTAKRAGLVVEGEHAACRRGRGARRLPLGRRAAGCSRGGHREGVAHSLGGFRREYRYRTRERLAATGEMISNIGEIGHRGEDIEHRGDRPPAGTADRLLRRRRSQGGQSGAGRHRRRRRPNGLRGRAVAAAAVARAGRSLQRARTPPNRPSLANGPRRNTRFVTGTSHPVTPSHAQSRPVTPSHAQSRPVTGT